MNQAYDYNGHVVAPSKPTKVLRTVKKTIHIDSADRDTSKFFTNGCWVAYLPRNYQNVTKIRLKSAEFPPLLSTTPVAPASAISGIAANTPASGYFTATVSSTSGFAVGNTVVITNLAGVTAFNGTYIIQSIPTTTTFTVKSSTSGTPTYGSSPLATITATPPPGAVSHDYSRGMNVPTATYSSDSPITTPTYYFTIELSGLNKIDETVVDGNKSTLIDNFFAKIPAMTQTYGTTSFIEYNESSNHDTTAVFSPPIENLDRLQIQTRLHSQQNNNGFIYWTSDGAVATASTIGGSANYNLTLEIEYLENGFDDFSSFETRLGCRN
jgi:hypothetical protein